MLEILIKSALLLALVAIADRLIRKQPASLRHVLWSFAIVGALSIPVLTRVTPFHLALWPSREQPATPAALSNSKHKPAKDKISTSADDPSDVAAVAADAQPENRTTLQPIASTLGSLPWTKVVLGLWALGAVILLTRLVVGLSTVQRIANRAREVRDPAWREAIDRAADALGFRWPVDVRFSDEGPMPFTCGVVRPIVVLPASAESWGAEQRDAVLLHELAHISRGDLQMNLLSHVMRAFYWVNPLAWLAAHRLRVEGERACDDTVLRAGAKASDYADHLLNIIKST
ncbi:MAG TPA: M56 family metallopeptidase, partial [Gemmatimonadaceae bacterium]